MRIFEDIFDDIKPESDIERDPEIIEPDNSYEFHLSFAFGMSNYAATTESVFGNVIKTIERRIKKGFDAFPFITDYSDFEYVQNPFSGEYDDLRLFKYGGTTVHCNSYAIENKNYLNALVAHVDLNMNIKNARQCLKLLGFLTRSNIFDSYSHMSKWLTIERFDSINEYTIDIGDNGNEYNFSSFREYSNTLYDLCIFIFGDEYTFGEMMTQLGTTNVESIIYQYYNKEDEPKYSPITKIGHFDNIGVATDPKCFKCGKSPYGDTLAIFTISGTLFGRYSDPWQTPNIYRKYGKYLESHGATIYITHPEQNEDIWNLLLVVFDGTFENIQDTEYVLTLEVTNDERKAKSVLSCFMSPEEAQKIIDEHFYSKEDWSDDWED